MFGAAWLERPSSMETSPLCLWVGAKGEVAGVGKADRQWQDS